MIKILKFTSPTCAPCKVLSSNLDALFTDLVTKEKVTDLEVTSYDVTTCSPDLLTQHQISSVPTMIWEDTKSRTITRLTGLQTYSQMLKLYLTLTKE